MKTSKRYYWLCRLWRKDIAIAALFLVTIIFINNTALAGDNTAFTLSKLGVADEIQDLLVEDLDVDGLKDILIIHRKGLSPEETRWISIFWQNARGGFSSAADQSWELDSSATILDIGDLAGDKQMEICYITADEVRYYPISSREYSTVPQVLFKAQGLTVFPSKRSIPLINFVRDWNDDGQDEIGIFGFKGLSVYIPDVEGKFSCENKILIELGTRMRRINDEKDDIITSGLSANFTFPDICLIDYNNDGRKDLISTTNDRLVIYCQKADGRFNQHADTSFFFDVLTQKEKIEEIGWVNTEVTDLNVDGYADAIVSKHIAKGLSQFRGVINIFWGQPEGYSSSPQQVIISEGTASAIVYIRDVNGDERKDLILPSVKISISAIIRMLITGSVPVNFNIFFLNQNNRFSDRPDFTKEVKFKIDLSGNSDTQAMGLADYNGDKREDFIFATKEDELSVYLGVPGHSDRLFSKKPAAKVAVDAFGELTNHDLNNDGHSDMIIYYPETKERKGIVQVLMNNRQLK